MPPLLWIILLILLSAAWLMWRLSARLQTSTGLPKGEVVYTDTGGWEQVEKPLVDEAHHLIGRPDYLVRTRRSLIPVEVKSGSRPTEPYPSHVLQLAAYCLLAEAVSGRPVPFGYLRYDNATLRIPFTEELRRELLTTIEAVRRERASKDVGRSHQEPARCRGCGLRHTCDQALV